MQSFIRKGNKKRRKRENERLNLLIFLESGTRILYVIATILLVLYVIGMIISSAINEDDWVISAMSFIVMAVSIIVTVLKKIDVKIKFFIMLIVSTFVYVALYLLFAEYIDENINALVSRLISSFCLIVTFAIEWIKIGIENDKDEERIINKYVDEKRNIR